MIGLFDKTCTVVDRAVAVAVVSLFAMMVLVGTAQISNRFVFGLSFSWAEEVQRYAHIWLVFLMIPVVYRKGAHIGIRLILDVVPPQTGKMIVVIIDILWLVMAMAIVVLSLRVMAIASQQTTPGIGVSMDLIYAGILTGGGYLMLTAVRRLLGIREDPVQLIEP